MCGHSAPPSLTVSSHLCRGRCDRLGRCRRGLCPDAPPQRAAAPGCRCWGALGVPALTGPPSPRSAPRVGVPLSRGAERGRPGQRQVWQGHLPWLSDCPRRAVSLQPGRGWAQVGSGLLIGVPEAGLGVPGGCGDPYRERDTLPSLPDTCCVITARSRGSPPKANGGCVPLPERWPGAAAQSGDSAFGSFSPAVSRSRNFLRPGPVRGSRAGPGGPRARGEPHTPGRVYM